MNELYDILEVCLQELDGGADVESVLARFPGRADELRSILKASLQARGISGTAPSADVLRRGRAKLMQRAAELREEQAVRRHRAIPMFQRLAISFTMTALLLASGTGLVRASSTALPGENLYPVKRSWEGLRLVFAFGDQKRVFLENEFESERLEEVSELLTEGRNETIQIAGVFMEVNGVHYVSGLPILISADTRLPAETLQNGAAVLVTGHTNSNGFVEVESIVLLPDGAVVPVGNPIQVELESESESESNSGSSGEGSEGGPRYYAVEGTLEAVTATTLAINGLTVYLENARIEGELCLGIQVEVKGLTAEDGRFIATEVDAKGSCSSGGGDENVNSNSNSNANDGSDPNDNASNSNDDSNDNGDDEDNSGSGSGGGGDDDDD